MGKSKTGEAETHSEPRQGRAVGRLPQQGGHAGLTEPVPTLSLLRAAQHQAALLTLVLVLHTLHKPLFVASLLRDKNSHPGTAVRVQLQRWVGLQ